MYTKDAVLEEALNFLILGYVRGGQDLRGIHTRKTMEFPALYHLLLVSRHVKFAILTSRVNLYVLRYDDPVPGDLFLRSGIPAGVLYSGSNRRCCVARVTERTCLQSS